MTVSIVPMSNFHQLSIAEASDILYDIVIPACERKKVHLSQYGNHRS